MGAGRSGDRPLGNAVCESTPAADAASTSLFVVYSRGIAADQWVVWVATLDGTVSRIDPETNRIVATIHIGHSPGSVAVGYGRVWVAVRE